MWKRNIIAINLLVWDYSGPKHFSIASITIAVFNRYTPPDLDSESFARLLIRPVQPLLKLIFPESVKCDHDNMNSSIRRSFIKNPGFKIVSNSAPTEQNIVEVDEVSTLGPAFGSGYTTCGFQRDVEYRKQFMLRVAVLLNVQEMRAPPEGAMIITGQILIQNQTFQE